MSGLAGVATQKNCFRPIYRLTNSHKHLGKSKGGMATRDQQFHVAIHDIERTPFLTKFETERKKLTGHLGIGVISSSDNQPLVFNNDIGHYAICVQGNFSNLKQLGDKLKKEGFNFREETYNPKHGISCYNKAELCGLIISTGSNIIEGIKKVWEEIKGHGSINLVLLTKDGIYAARDPRGTFPLTLGQNNHTYSIVSETTAFPNLNFKTVKELLPGEILFFDRNGYQTLSPGQEGGKICTFLYIYTAMPPAVIQGINVEKSRYRTGAKLWQRYQDFLLKANLDYIAGIPDSGIGHALGAERASGIHLERPLVKLDDERSYIFTTQEMRDEAADFKITVVEDVITGKRFFILDDSLVRNTQFRWLVKKIAACHPDHVILGLACPALTHICPFEESTRDWGELAACRVIELIERKPFIEVDLTPYLDPQSDKYQLMVKLITKEVNREASMDGVHQILYQYQADMLSAIGTDDKGKVILPPERFCTYCWDGQM